jgi:uncharacterized membrane protein SpoIIM required for sporulation
MDYARFSERGEPHWNELAALLARTGERPTGLDHDELERLASLHRRAAADFATARTQFPGTELERRLRSLAFSGHSLLAQRIEPLPRRIVNFYLHDYGPLFRQHAPALRTALALFGGGALLGGLLTSINPDFALLVLGPEQLQMVKRGEIWTDMVSSVAPPSVLSSKIFTNNVGVAIAAWAGGALLGVGTLSVVVTNGIMLGSLLVLSARYGVLDRLFAFIAAHGPLEIFLITVAAAAGLTLARAEIAFDPLPRREAIAVAARDSVRLMLGTLPWLVLLGIVEGYISPVMSLPTGVKAAVGVVLLGSYLATVTARRS